MVISAGVIIINDDGKILGCVPFGRSRYAPNTLDIPKGKVEEGESAKDGAIREVFEETGIDLTGVELIDLGQHVYIKGKDLHLFKCNYNVSVDSLKCSSDFERNGQMWPEVIGYEWISIENISTRFYRSLVKLLNELLTF